ncbi:MAG: LysM peptidoglycan-binding domain-containing protein [Chloroflexota bacterium]|nr:MAG: LysM peptidoglycan-binding domain-containing protein [Chloroflexota bacterium]
MNKLVFSALAMLTLIGLVFAGAPLVQAQSTACVETYTVAAGDTLGAIAQKYLGAIEAYPQIVTATNEAAKTDKSFTNIADPNRIEVGQKVCIPAKSATAPTAASTTAATTATPAKTGGAAAGFYTNTGPAADASALITLLTLDPNGGAVMTQTYVSKGGFVSTGAWSQNGNTVTINFATQDGKPSTSVAVLTVDGDKLTTTQDEGKVFSGAPGFVMTKTPADVVALSGVYNTTLAAAGSVPERFIALTLTPDGEAMFVDNPTGQEGIAQTGTWTASGNKATVNLTKQDDKDIQKKFVFELQGENLVAVEYDQADWGTTGLTLKRVEGIGALSAVAPATPTPAPATPTAAPTAVPLTLAQLGNATYTVEGAPGGDVTLKDGKAEEEVAPGSASKFTAQIVEPFANGTLDGKPYAAADLVTSGGGSGVFHNLAVVPNNNGQPGAGVTTLLGDRIKVTAIAFENNLVKVSTLERKDGEPFSADPTVPVTTYYQLTGGKLVEAQPGTSTAPTPTPGTLEGTYISTQPAADAVALLWTLDLGPNANASWLSNYIGKGTSNATGVWAQTGPTTLNVVLNHRDDKNINEKFTFEVQGDKLVATDYNHSLYGDSGITFYKTDAQVTGSVSYLQKIALPDDAVYEVYLVDMTNDAAPVYISGVSNRTNGQQVPLPFSLPYDSAQINPSGKYVVQAFISSTDRLLFKNSSGVAVITNGAPTSNVEVLVEQPAP